MIFVTTGKIGVCGYPPENLVGFRVLKRREMMKTADILGLLKVNYS